MSRELVDAAALAFRFILAFVFLAAAVPKLAGRREFQRAVANFGLLPRRLVGPVAAVLPPMELVCAAALLVGFAVTPIALAAAVLLILFGLAIAVNLARGRQIDCGCSGSVAPRTISWELVAGDLALAAMALVAALANPNVLAIGGTGTASSLTSGDAIAMLLLGGGTLVLTQLLVSSWRMLWSVAK